MSVGDNFDYYNFRIKNITTNIQQEIDYYVNNKYILVPQYNEYVEYLKKRIGKHTDQQKMLNNMTYTKYDNRGNKCELKNIDIEQYSKDLDVFVFKKPWNKMQKIHKIMKIKEYVSNLEYKSNKPSNAKISKNRSFIIDQLVSGIENKKYNKNGSVVDWSMTDFKINGISCLDYNNDTGLYEIDWSN